MNAAVITGLGTWLPDRIVTNVDLAAELDTSDDWIRSRTGIGRRHVVEPGTSTGDLAEHAVRLALDSAGLDHLDALVLATSTPDHSCPATAPAVAARLGLHGAAFDIGAVCSGFVYGLATGAGLIAAGLAATVAVVGADCYSLILDPTDRSTRAIFGDGAGAVVLRAGDAEEHGALRGFDLGSDGTHADLIEVAGGGARERSLGTPLDPWFRMAGRPVFHEAVLRMAASATATLDRVGWRPDEIGTFVAHQANQRILNAVGLQLGLRPDQVAVHLDRVGNTVAASIPLALADAATRGGLEAGARVLTTGFGGGLTWGSVAFTWPDLVPKTSH